MKTVTHESIYKAWAQIKPVQNDPSKVRPLFFSFFRKNDVVPADNVALFRRLASLVYDKNSAGYKGIIKEVRDRVELYADIDGQVLVKEFFVHADGLTDFYDSENRIAYEKKTGCGNWLYSEKYVELNDVIEEYKRKRRLLRWDYDFKPVSERCEGGKDLKNENGEREKVFGMENRKSQKQYELHIHIETTYKRFFEYLALYPSGVKTFFKYNAVKSQYGTTVYDLQTIKTSQKKIAFLQAFNAWDKMNK